MPYMPGKFLTRRRKNISIANKCYAKSLVYVLATNHDTEDEQEEKDSVDFGMFEKLTLGDIIDSTAFMLEPI